MLAEESDPRATPLPYLIKGTILRQNEMEEQQFNTRYKYYPNNVLAQIMVCSRDVFKPKAEIVKPIIKDKITSLEEEYYNSLNDEEKQDFAFMDNYTDPDIGLLKATENERRARSRARVKVFDYVSCNTWDYFITLTLDPKMIDRYDYPTIINKANRWLDNRVRRVGLRYIIVPELHPTSGAIHFHGLVNDVLPRTYSHHFDKRHHTVYNLPDWTLGWTTAIHTYGDQIAVAKYITKYVTKTDHIIGGRWYLHGGDIIGPTYDYDNLNYDEVQSDNVFEFTPQRCGDRFKIISVNTKIQTTVENLIKDDPFLRMDKLKS